MSFHTKLMCSCCYLGFSSLIGLIFMEVTNHSYSLNMSSQKPLPLPLHLHLHLHASLVVMKGSPKRGPIFTNKLTIH